MDEEIKNIISKVVDKYYETIELKNPTNEEIQAVAICGYRYVRTRREGKDNFLFFDRLKQKGQTE